jgi:hypothetical protein
VRTQPNPDAELAYLRASSLRKRTNASYRDAGVPTSAMIRSRGSRSLLRCAEATLPRRSVRSAGKTHAFANDRTDIDLLGTRAALADLLLLDDLVPPIAVCMCGSLGAGKSTLIRLLQ